MPTFEHCSSGLVSGFATGDALRMTPGGGPQEERSRSARRAQSGDISGPAAVGPARRPISVTALGRTIACYTG